MGNALSSSQIRMLPFGRATTGTTAISIHHAQHPVQLVKLRDPGPTPCGIWHVCGRTACRPRQTRAHITTYQGPVSRPTARVPAHLAELPASAHPNAIRNSRFFLSLFFCSKVQDRRPLRRHMIASASVHKNPPPPPPPLLRRLHRNGCRPRIGFSSCWSGRPGAYALPRQVEFSLSCRSAIS